MLHHYRVTGDLARSDEVLNRLQTSKVKCAQPGNTSMTISPETSSNARATCSPGPPAGYAQLFPQQ